MTESFVVMVRLDRDTYRAWRKRADDERTDVGPLLAHAARRAITPRSPQPRTKRGKYATYVRLDAAQRAEVLAEPGTPASVLAQRYGCSDNTIRNIRKAAAS